MRHFLILAFFLLLIPTIAWCQPTIYLPTQLQQPSDQFCVDVKVNDFTDITSMQFSLKWDSEAIEFKEISRIKSEFDNISFNTNNSGEGIMTIDWTSKVPDQGVTIRADGLTIFSLCFEVIGDCGMHSPIDISNEPMPISITRENTGDLNIGLFEGDGFIAICNYPLVVSTDMKNGDPNERVCVPVRVKNFDNISTFQFALTWNTDIIDYAELKIPEVLPNFNSASFGLPPDTGNDNELTVSWNVVSDDGYTLPDDTILFEICYDLVGDGRYSSPIEFETTATKEAFAFNEEINQNQNVGILNEIGRVRINSGDGAVPVIISNGVVEPNDTICLAVTVREFTNITAMNYQLNWSTALLHYIDGSLTPSGRLPGLIIDDTNATNGSINTQWDMTISQPNGLTLSDNTILYTLCFEAIGQPDTTAKVSFLEIEDDNQFSVFDNTGQNIGIDAQEGSITILPLKALTLYAPHIEAKVGETVTVDIKVADFEDIQFFNFPITWEPIFEFVSWNPVALADIDANLITRPTQDVLLVDWFDLLSVNPQTLADSTTLLQITFKIPPTVTPGVCSPISFTDIEYEADVATLNSDGVSIRVDKQDGEICTLAPEAYTVNLPDSDLNTGESICVPFEVTGFNNVLETQFSMNWSASVLQLDSIRNTTNALPNFSLDSFDLRMMNNGFISFHWTDEDLDNTDTTGISVNDQTALFDLCFTAIGERLECSNVQLANIPLQAEVITVASKEEVLPITLDTAKLCINDALVLQDTIFTPESCSNQQDGAIELVIIGGTTPYTYQWEDQPTNDTPRLVGLSTGTYCVTVSDQNGLNLEACLDVSTSVESIIADAGIDRSHNCGGDMRLELDGSGSTQQPENTMAYNWVVLTGDGQVVLNSTTLRPTIIGSGDFELTVENTNTGCAAKDTVSIFPAATPDVSAGEDKILLCGMDTLQLDGMANTPSNDLVYEWSTNDGQIVEGEELETSPSISAAGTYILKVIDAQAQGCTATDTVIVIDNRTEPIADAGEDNTLKCDEPLLTLSANFVDETNNSYAWEAIDTGRINGVSNTPNVSVEAAGNYLLSVTDRASNCTSTDTIFISDGTSKPRIISTGNRWLTCDSTVITMDVTVESTMDYEISWIASGGGHIVDGYENTLNAKVDAAGKYDLIISDANDCVSIEQISVKSNTIAPIADAGEDTIFECGKPSLQLNAAITEGDSITYLWTYEDTTIMAIVAGEDSPTPIVEAYGEYFLTTRNVNNGCIANDTLSVLADPNGPTVRIATPPLFPCSGTPIQLDASESIGDGSYNYLWEALSEDALILSGENTVLVTIGSPGTYRLTVSDGGTCEGSEEVQVMQDAGDIRAIASTSGTLTCDNTIALLNATGSTMGDDIKYEWKGLDRGVFIDNINSGEEVQVTEAGRYELMVFDQETGCFAVDTTTVISERDTLIALINSQATALSCNRPFLQLDASSSLIIDPILFKWETDENGHFLEGDSTLTPTIDAAGTYTLILINPETGCSDSTSIDIVYENITVSASIQQADTLSCQTTSVLLDASSSLVNEFTTVEWIAESGITISQDSLQLAVELAGNYRLQLIDTLNACTSFAEIMVSENKTVPDNMPLLDKSIVCPNSEVVIGNTPNDAYTYSWSSTDGHITNDSNQAQITVNQAGSYQLTITDKNSGCSINDTVIIQTDYDLELANAVFDYENCTDSLVLLANQPAQTTGLWTLGTNLSTTDNLADSTLIIRNLQGNNYQFVWTLSTSECPNYSSDTLSVNISDIPNVNNDTYEIVADNIGTNLPILANDRIDRNTTSAIILDNPTVGNVTLLEDGSTTYQVANNYKGQDEFTYQVCDLNCPDLCDIGFVKLFITPNTSTLDSILTDVPSGITPNDDGVNDYFVFSILEDNNTLYPDNQLIVYNRWGDVVFIQNDYNNDWNGSGMNGQVLPQGTYYYVLKLDISEGIILSGTITILR